MNKKQQKNPQIFCLGFLVIIFLALIVDYKQVIFIYLKFVDWIKENPFTAITVITLLYTVSIVLMAPITYLHIMIGFTYSQVFSSSLDGWMIAAPTASLGCMLGGGLGFLVSKYVL